MLHALITFVLQRRPYFGLHESDLVRKESLARFPNQSVEIANQGAKR